MIKTFIKRIWLTIVLSCLMIFSGGLSFKSLDWNMEAKHTKNVITVTIASKTPTTVNGMEKVSRTLEKKFKQIKNVDYFSSSIDAQKVQIEVFLKSGVNIQESLREVGNIVVTAKKPDYVKPPQIQQSSKSDNALIDANVYSKNLSLGDVTKYAKDVIAGKLEKIEGVSYVEIKGEPKQEIQIKINEDKIAYYNIGISQIRRTFDVLNTEKGFASRETSINEFSVVGESAVKTLKDVQNAIVDYQRMIKLSDIATVEFNKKDFLSEVWVNGDSKVVSIKVFKTNEGNPLKTAREVMKVLNHWIQDQKLESFIEDNSEDINIFFQKTKKTFIEAIIIVLAVVLIFLGSFKAALTPILAIPISLIATFLPMKVTGCSLNVSTLMAFLIAIGLVVDDAILVVENIIRYYSQGMSKAEAAEKGTTEIQIPVIVMTLTLACVFAPAILSEGAFGATLREFAITLSVAVIFSGIISLTLTPAISARILSYSHLVDKIFAPVEYGYRFLLRLALKFRWIFVGFSVFSVATSGLMLKSMPRESYPSVERRELEIYSISSGNKHLHFFKKNGKIIADYLKKHPDIDNFVIYMEKYIYLDMKFKKQSTRSKENISKDIMTFLKTKIKDVNFVEKSSKSNTGFDIYMYGNTTRTEIEHLGKEFASELRKDPDIANAIQYSTKKYGYNVVIDYQKAALVGCDIESLERIVELINTRYYVSVLERDGRRYKIISLVDKNQDINKVLQRVWNEVKNRENIKISPSVFSKIVQVEQVTNLINFNGLPGFKLEIGGNPKTRMGDLVKKIQKIHKKVAGHKTEIAFTGKAKEFLEDSGEMERMFLFSTIFIFMILLAQFESLKSAFLVMMTAPLAIWGALISIKGSGSLNIYSMIAMITLVGLIIKHGILFVNTANEYKTEKSLFDAAFFAASDRLRPVLMTTFAMILGLIPIMFEKDPSMVKLVQMVKVLIPGLSIGTIMTLFVIPSLYVFINKEKNT